jgi:hypothetical protein
MDSSLNLTGYALPVELRIDINEIGRRGVAQLPIDANLFEFRVQSICLAQIMRIPKLPDKIRGAEQHSFFARSSIIDRRRRKTCVLNSVRDPRNVKSSTFDMRSKT